MSDCSVSQIGSITLMRIRKLATFRPLLRDYCIMTRGRLGPETLPNLTDVIVGGTIKSKSIQYWFHLLFYCSARNWNANKTFVTFKATLVSKHRGTERVFIQTYRLSIISWRSLSPSHCPIIYSIFLKLLPYFNDEIKLFLCFFSNMFSSLSQSIIIPGNFFQ